MSQRIDIAVGVLRQGDRILLAQRQAKQSHALKWEFPGGKVEAVESIEAALVREFQEEVGVETSDWKPLIQIPWDYDTVSVHLHVYESDQFQGAPHGKEGQPVQWTVISELHNYEFPEANRGILSALKLPDVFMISGNFHDEYDALGRLEAALDEGVRLVQLRAKQMEETDFIALAKKAIALTHRYNEAKILINGKPDWLDVLPEADGLQLASTAIMDLTDRPISKDKILSISTHTKTEIAKALELKADLLLLSPVKKTSSHPDMDGMGWETFSEMVADIPIPVFALGGMKQSDVEQATSQGAQGIAAISGLWPDPI
ncbi:Nudix family hydrolase [Hydrogenovibrio sp. 3SP14C1]|uniref:Nudix family hydrolase n=1 Tax=Hydrogenovibrio sp. 3SP14C1 TaxID=3038774 RepID=UPI002417759D|nr:Nudix family hydrolase [Hydrogenovibrio sp. 3SP14C1]MDG4811829.1 Nudix family hydrolase [Hydrogenovibrio sp. 3SP14C1]